MELLCHSQQQKAHLKIQKDFPSQDPHSKVRKNIIQQVSKLFIFKTFIKGGASRAPGVWLTLVRFEICIDESLVVSKYGSGHSRPWLADAQSSIDIISCYYLSLLKNQKVGDYSTRLKTRALRCLSVDLHGRG